MAEQEVVSNEPTSWAPLPEPEMEPERAALLMRVENDFLYHAPVTPIRVEAHENWNRMCATLARYAANNLPLGRHLSLTITELEMVRMMGNQAIALSQGPQ